MLRALCATTLTLLLAGTAMAAPDGSHLYAQHCAACHGDQGSGGVGVPLALPGFLAAASDTYLQRTIRLGRPGRVMPAFIDLDDSEVQAIVSHIRSWGSPHPEMKPTPVQGDVARGKILFAAHCVACHGANGEGGKGTGVTFSRPRELPVVAPALNNPGFLAAAPDAMIKYTLMHGREGTPMVSFLEQGLSESDIDDLVAYVRSFESRLPDTGPEPDMAPVLVYESSYGFQETVDNVKRAAVGRNFRIIREQALDEGLVPAGEEDSRRMMVYFCNFKFLNDVLKIDPRVGLFLPCRVTVVEHEGVVSVMTINPSRLSHLFNNNELDEACKAMRDLYDEILEEATL